LEIRAVLVNMMARTRREEAVMRAIMFPVVLLFLLTACAGAQSLVWYQPGAGEALLAADVEACLAEADVEPVSPVISRKLSEDYYDEKEREYRDCMKLRGWRIVDAGEVEVPWEGEQGRYPTIIWEGVLAN